MFFFGTCQGTLSPPDVGCPPAGHPVRPSQPGLPMPELPAALLDSLRFAVFDLTFVTRAPLLLPEFRGNVFRGALGKSLRRLSCTLDRPDCSGCLLQERCLYTRLFDSPNRLSDSLVSTERVPHPFVIHLPDQDRFQFPAQTPFVVRLTLVGRAIDDLPYFILAFEEIGRTGIGPERVPLMLREVRNGADPIYETEARRIVAPVKVTAARDIPPEVFPPAEVTVHFTTPLRLQVEGKFQKQIRFDWLASHLLRRLTLLASHHCGAPARHDVRELLVAAKEVVTAAENLHWVHLQRYSFRQEREVAMGGVAGQITYRGDLAPFMPLLRLGEHLHVGKNTAFGLGHIRVEAAGSKS